MPSTNSIAQFILDIGARAYTKRVKYIFERLGIVEYSRHIYLFFVTLFAGQVITLNKDGGKSRIIIYSDGTISPYPEKEIIEDVLSSVTNEDCLLDIGANFGRYCCIVSSLYDESNIIAIEPNPSTADILRKNITSNNLSGKVFQCALSDSEGEMSLSMPNIPERSRLSTSEDTDPENNVIVDVKRGDKFIKENNLTTPTIVKIDVEGAELGVVSGMEEILRNEDCRLLYCEVHPLLMEKFGSTEEELFEKLAELGFNSEVISEREVQYNHGSEIQKFIKAEK